MIDLNLTVLKLDLDRKWTLCGWTRNCERMVQVLDLLAIRVFSVEVRRTVKGYHVLLWLEGAMPDATTLCAVQAMLGSDGVREAMNLRRVNQGRTDDWNVLFIEKAGRPPVKPAVDYAGVLVRALRRAGHLASVTPL